MRQQLTMTPDRRAGLTRPAVPVRQLTLRPDGLPPLDALVARPETSTGVLVYFPGFNTPLGPWETAKCQFLADASSKTVILTEIPGMSRFRDPIPRAIRQDMLHHRSDSWAELMLTYIDAAGQEVDPADRSRISVLGYSTGCSLAASALPRLAEWGRIEALNLVEPVAITQRNIATLHLHNLADFGRMPAVNSTNSHHEWVLHARRRQRREPNVHYSAPDLLAIASVLASDTLLADLRSTPFERCALARGARSSLCRARDYERLDGLLREQAIPGPTITVEGLGHQMWHSFPVIVQLTSAMMAA
ncbi:MAG: hypothetical protein WAQ75_04910 [Propionicimonas sp.]